MNHDVSDLIKIFHACYFKDYNTVLVKGDLEPIYLPQDHTRPHNEIIFAHGFFASALHECAHWLVAGSERRKLEDFGYWYEPDGRSQMQQALFHVVEIKPQAIEWILSQACGFQFHMSQDNLNGSVGDCEGFKNSVYEQVKQYCQKGLHPRAEIFRSALCLFYGVDSALKIENFDRNCL